MKPFQAPFITGVLFSILSCCSVYGHIPTQKETAFYRQRLDELVLPKCLSIPEGGFVYYYHPTVKTWLEQPFEAGTLKEIEHQLKGLFEIPFTKEGFTKAVSRPEGDPFGEVSYSAIWVRDCCWHYYGLKIGNPKAAAKLLLSLLKFYSSDEQVSRFISIIEKPELADPNLEPMAHMKVPLIRFSAKTLSHHQTDGKDQEWNHIQFDSHGLFLLALSDALSSNVLQPEDLTPEHYKVLALFPAFFSQTKYAQKKDAGPWEEELLYNASSAGLVASGLKRAMEVIYSKDAFKQGLQRGIALLKSKSGQPQFIQTVKEALSSENIHRLYKEGVERAERNLNLGGEAPDLSGKGLDRRADAALLFLALVEHTPFYEQPEQIRKILAINSSLVGPYGVYRYKYDPYQAANYWIDFDLPSAISGAQTPVFAFATTMRKGYMPHQQPHDAQWFFDSCFADLYYHLSMLEKNRDIKAYYVRQGDIHLKRSLAQLTGLNSYAANGEKLEPFQMPESINTVLDAYYNARPFHSPICPLSWSCAALQMALSRAQAAHAQ